VLSVAAHAAVLAAVVWGVTRPEVEKKRDLEVTFYAAPPSPPPAPPPPPPAGGAERPQPERAEPPRPVKTPDTVYEMPEKPRPKAREPEPRPEPEPTEAKAPEPSGATGAGVESGVPGGVKEGVAGGVAGGVPSGTPGGQPGSAAPPQSVVIPFGAGMTRPSRIAGRDPQYTREALAARVEGLAIVKCVIKVDGTLTRCRLIKSLPHMDKEILAAVSTQRFTPVMFQGRPVSVDYVFNIRLKLP
jgi:protein TonB